MSRIISAASLLREAKETEGTEFEKTVTKYLNRLRIPGVKAVHVGGSGRPDITLRFPPRGSTVNLEVKKNIRAQLFSGRLKVYGNKWTPAQRTAEEYESNLESDTSFLNSSAEASSFLKDLLQWLKSNPEIALDFLFDQGVDENEINNLTADSIALVGSIPESASLQGTFVVIPPPLMTSFLSQRKNAYIARRAVSDMSALLIEHHERKGNSLIEIGGKGLFSMSSPTGPFFDAASEAGIDIPILPSHPGFIYYRIAQRRPKGQPESSPIRYEIQPEAKYVAPGFPKSPYSLLSPSCSSSSRQETCNPLAVMFTA
jgi:hypothetical protein